MGGVGIRSAFGVGLRCPGVWWFGARLGLGVWVVVLDLDGGWVVWSGCEFVLYFALFWFGGLVVFWVWGFSV